MQNNLVEVEQLQDCMHYKVIGKDVF